MHIILDSNIYLSDIRMQSNRFSSLFDYVRRTRSRLILPAMVRDEVVARHREGLLLEITKTQKQLKALQRYAIGEVRFDAPNPTAETNKLKALLRNPREGVRSFYLSNLAKIDVEELIRRGIDRTPPASQAGEELRDVALWLAILNHAKSVSSDVVFVTEDKGFWDGDKPQQQIVEDIGTAGVRMRLYRTLADFVRDKALLAEPLSCDWAAQHIDLDALKSSILSKTTLTLEKRRLLQGSPELLSIKQIQCQHCTLYRTSDDAAFAEIDYLLDLIVRTKFVLPQWAILTPSRTEPLAAAGHWGTIEFGDMATEPQEIQAVKKAYFVRATLRISGHVVGSSVDAEVDDVGIVSAKEISQSGPL